MKPRFTVGTVRGGATQKARRNDSIWYVHDSAYGYRIAATVGGNAPDPEARARAICDRLNAKHTAHLEELT